MSTLIAGLPRCLVEDYDNFVRKYPFTKEAKQRISTYCIEDIFRDREFRDKLVSFVEHILKTGKVNQEMLMHESTETSILLHYAAILLVSQLPRRVWTKFAEAESKYFSDNLCTETDRECIMYIAKQFNINVVKVHQLQLSEKLKLLYDVAVPVWTYLKYMPRNDPNWKLSCRYLARGYVLLRYSDIIKLVEEAVEKQIVNMLETASQNVTVGDLIRESLGETFDRLYRRYSQVSLTTKIAQGEIKGKYPPCIEQIINEIKSGGNPSHMARFTVAAFLLHVLTEYEGKSIEEAVEEVVDLFRTVADFDEKKTRYQVMHIAGLVGGRKFYMPPNCDELISLGLCPNNGACGVKNPLVAYARSIRAARRKRQQMPSVERDESEKNEVEVEVKAQG